MSVIILVRFEGFRWHYRGFVGLPVSIFIEFEALDGRLESLGGVRFCDRGESDERTGLMEVEPWIDGLVAKVKDCL